jgi:anti-anti-sigma factor
MDPIGRVFVDIAQTSTSRALVLSISGDVDAATIPTVDARVRAAVLPLPPPGLVVVDLTEVVGISVAGVRLLKSVVDACATRGVDVRLVISKKSIVHRIFTVADPHGEIPVFPTLAQALE